MSLPNSLLYAGARCDPLILGQDFCVHHCTGCAWTPYGTKRFMVNQKLVF